MALKSLRGCYKLQQTFRQSYLLYILRFALNIAQHVFSESCFLHEIPGVNQVSPLNGSKENLIGVRFDIFRCFSTFWLESRLKKFARSKFFNISSKGFVYHCSLCNPYFCVSAFFNAYSS